MVNAAYTLIKHLPEILEHANGSYSGFCDLLHRLDLTKEEFEIIDSESQHYYDFVKHIQKTIKQDFIEPTKAMIDNPLGSLFKSHS